MVSSFFFELMRVKNPPYNNIIAIKISDILGLTD